MPLSQSDRITFSSQIVAAAAQIAGLAKAQAQIQTSINGFQSLDTANNNLLIPVNTLATAYQTELSDLDGNGRTSFVESDIQNAAKKVIQNDFFPNNTQVTVPSLAASNNIWTQTVPYALNFAIGKNYSEAYTSVTSEPSLITAILNLISATSIYTDLELTTGVSDTGTCSLPQYTTESTCTSNGGTWTPTNFTTIVNGITAAVNTLLTFLNTEVAGIVTTDTTSPNQANNAAAVNNINNVIIPAINTWLAYPNFESTGAGPSKMHSTQMGALVTALNNRSTFITTRISQLNTVLGSITQNVTTGAITASSGLYGKRYSYLSLRLNVLNGSLTQLVNAQAAVSAQTSIQNAISGTAALYQSFLPTSALAASASGTNIVNLVNASAYSPGDAVYVMADSQIELNMAIKSISGNLVTLNAAVPAKYTTALNARLYKDLT